MLKRIRGWFQSKEPEVPQPEDLFARIELNLGTLNHEDITQRYSVRKAMHITMNLSSPSPRIMSEWLSNASRVVDKLEYVPEPWKQQVRVEESYVLDNWFTDGGFLVDVPTWLRDNHPRMVRLVKGFRKMEDDDAEYYQRNYNSVLRDVDALLLALRAALV